MEDKKPDNFICQKCGNMETDKMCSKYCLNIEGKIKQAQKKIFGNLNIFYIFVKNLKHSTK